ncbi:retrovirus-related pol polyprotein from transposon TNT 1-94 [Tanacetum coccineum]
MWTEFKNHAMNEFCAKKGIKREFSVARTPQQNGVAERKNRTLIEAARTMLADSLLPIPFWAEAVNTACYGESLFSFMRPLVPLTILNTLDSLGKFDGKSDEGYLLGYSTSSKAFRVYNKRTKRVEENLHINFLEDQPNVAGTGPNWMTRIPVKDVVLYAQEQPSENAYLDKDIEDLEDVIDKEGQHQMPEDEQVWQDELEMMVTQELVANAMNDVSRQVSEEENRRIAFQKKAAQATSTNKLSTNRPSVSTDRPYVSTDRICHMPWKMLLKLFQMMEIFKWSFMMMMKNGVWILVDLPFGKKAIGTKWVFRNKRDKRSIVVKNKARLIAQGHRQEEGIDYDEVLQPVARIEAIRLFLAISSYKGFLVY